MPTEQELDDLARKCDRVWTTVNGVNGYVVRGRGEYASNSIFLSCAGGGLGASLYNSGSSGYYWSSVPYSDDDYSWSLYFDSSRHGTYYSRARWGQHVLPLGY